MNTEWWGKKVNPRYNSRVDICRCEPPYAPLSDLLEKWCSARKELERQGALTQAPTRNAQRWYAYTFTQPGYEYCPMVFPEGLSAEHFGVRQEGPFYSVVEASAAAETLMYERAYVPFQPMQDILCG